jgi:hypothetical protein
LLDAECTGFKIPDASMQGERLQDGLAGAVRSAKSVQD